MFFSLRMTRPASASIDKAISSRLAGPAITSEIALFSALIFMTPTPTTTVSASTRMAKVAPNFILIVARMT